MNRRCWLLHVGKPRHADKAPSVFICLQVCNCCVWLACARLRGDTRRFRGGLGIGPGVGTAPRAACGASSPKHQAAIINPVQGWEAKVEGGTGQMLYLTLATLGSNLTRSPGQLLLLIWAARPPPAGAAAGKQTCSPRAWRFWLFHTH